MQTQSRCLLPAQILGGGTKHGECVYYGDVAAKVMGWDITLRRGSNKEGQPLIHIGKALRWWDKNTKVYLSVSAGSEVDLQCGPLLVAWAACPAP